ncbi:MAG: LAGLIDADG homing endonuclease [Candidatus Daviesbacteria bacterium GW2011_GWA1_41_61]|uniref:LAGLIDADG endonuclease n=1 Tax=Candidatus Daviesbacteria bacterium GW2011_GWA2_40_9 TaxID=1618424 RepID=A0A0G0TY15_9BACT|nr:MAG: LAGLIDADG endonuclease [Candidatus Daviesbacteria bacterium GW2011_GWA2_40_9]KKR92356.1 MAG: LAGLIDADG homing endonuclease [Candidatus Daviesbacteria bacterium GW2011_GWB1_41_15]KKS14544.1 MAG: LAGLIDADG homing endonuclease [Candidatus Daviesbacteria bacterium GW2011_GWA1_41_61]
MNVGREKPESLSDDYIIGLTDGEGCFYVDIRAPKGEYKSYRVELHFFIKLREDELLLLQKVQKFKELFAISSNCLNG